MYRRILGLLDAGHEVGMAAFCPPEERDRAEELRDRLVALDLLPPPRGALPLRRRMTCGFSFVPPPFSASASTAMSRLVGDRVEEHRYDVVLAEYSEMGQHVFRNPTLSAVRVVMSCHRCATVAARKQIEVLGGSLHTLYRRMWFTALRHFEFRMYEAADRLLVLTPEERNELLGYHLNVPITVIPSGVDGDAFRRPTTLEPREQALVFTGHFADAPNRDGMAWMIGQIWPRLTALHPDLRLYIVGPGVTPSLREAARRDGRLVLTGYQDDVRPFLHRGLAFVNPMRMGSGLRGKVLEAMAAELPVVSTSLGMEGIPAQTGRHCLIADQADLMADQIDLLLTDRALRQSIAREARRLVEDRFSWDYGVRRLETVLCEVTGR